ncbi:MAG: STAS/SEC14 domain-containing protein [Desulfarculus sp.]|nr:STAS/SEC14 domain-containing protein [Pseudomonadota bacterium]MBV1714990.1 STAS/SEC14 domain-containing protein [Desulfarculus sp.]MBU4573867.1 STAS/SEC14 domain-containing protein [Pseudomonadota bacterium]MBU4598957.1 STAS/SEC14 domain-containing protein [Pseudomonadota bacterium]MBV1737490.1 STAS/SEC14 domain-containing protein [Desulfarculus sp.]
MFKVMPESGDRLLAVEVLRTYSKKDVEAFDQIMDQWMARAGGRLNMLIRLDRLDLSKVTLDNYIEDCRRALQRRDNLERIAVVGDSEMARSLVTMDNLIMANAKRGVTERYFDVEDIEKAWAFVRA